MKPQEPIGPPATQHAAWRHRGARDGFEALFMHETTEGRRCDGVVVAVEDGVPWVVRYSVHLDPSWTTREAHVSGASATGGWELRLEADGKGGWQVDGEPARELDGCLDIDLEASVFTNALPIHRLQLGVGESADAPAGYVRALTPRFELLEQRYERLADDGQHPRYDYGAPAFDFRAVLTYDKSGLILDYPGIGTRAA